MFEFCERSCSVSMAEGMGRCIGRAAYMGLVQGQVDHVSVTYSAFGNNVVGKALHIGATSLKHGNFHATLLIEMHVQRRLSEVVVLVEVACEALRQFALSVVVNTDQRRHTRMGSTELHGRPLEAGAGEVADRLRAVVLARAFMNRSSSPSKSSSIVMVTRCIFFPPYHGRLSLRHFPAIRARRRSVAIVC